MRTISHGAGYSIPEWRAWLGRHGINIDDTRSVDLYDSHAVAHVYAIDKDGMRYAIDDQVVETPVTFKFQTPPPVRP